jgi:hypothetical protein
MMFTPAAGKVRFFFALGFPAEPENPKPFYAMMVSIVGRLLRFYLDFLWAAGRFRHKLPLFGS